MRFPLTGCIRAHAGVLSGASRGLMLQRPIVIDTHTHQHFTAQKVLTPWLGYCLVSESPWRFQASGTGFAFPPDFLSPFLCFLCRASPHTENATWRAGVLLCYNFVASGCHAVDRGVQWPFSPQILSDLSLAFLEGTRSRPLLGSHSGSDRLARAILAICSWRVALRRPCRGCRAKIGNV